jgi:hypothetical protein
MTVHTINLCCLYLAVKKAIWPYLLECTASYLANINVCCLLKPEIIRNKVKIPQQYLPIKIFTLPILG